MLHCLFLSRYLITLDSRDLSIMRPESSAAISDETTEIADDFRSDRRTIDAPLVRLIWLFLFVGYSIN
jgi:hypothetical protein